jgi:hypothetical protein
MPEGVSYEGIFGERPSGNLVHVSAFSLRPANPARDPHGYTFQIFSGRRNERPAEIVNAPANVTNLSLSTTVDEKKVRLEGVDKDYVALSQGIKATNLVKPEYPKTAKVDSAVNVQVTLDAEGTVVAARAVSGDKAFHSAAETSAREAKFEIPKLELEIVKITGIIAYKFTAKDKSVVVAEQLQNAQVEVKPNKYHSSVKALVERLKNKRPAAAGEAKFVRDGKGDLIVRLKELKPETVDELKKFGFEVLSEMPSAKAVVGRIAIEKISALAKIDAVTFISPQNR